MWRAECGDVAWVGGMKLITKRIDHMYRFRIWVEVTRFIDDRAADAEGLGEAFVG